MRYLTTSRESSRFSSCFPEGPSTDSWFRAMGQCVSAALFCAFCLWLPQFSLSLSNCSVIPCHPHPTSVRISRAGQQQVSRIQPIRSSSGAEVTQVKMKKPLKNTILGQKDSFKQRSMGGGGILP